MMDVKAISSYPLRRFLLLVSEREFVYVWTSSAQIKMMSTFTSMAAISRFSRLGSPLIR